MSGRSPPGLFLLPKELCSLREGLELQQEEWGTA